MENNELEIGTKIAIRFLRDYEEFGSLGHLYAADAMLAVIQAANNSDKKKLLAAKIYSEYMAALEDLGALCIAVRHRDEGVGIIYNYLTYEIKKKSAPPTSVEEIYGLVKNGGGLKTALRLPLLDEIIQRTSTLDMNILSMHYKECNIFSCKSWHRISL